MAFSSLSAHSRSLEKNREDLRTFFSEQNYADLPLKQIATLVKKDLEDLVFEPYTLSVIEVTKTFPVESTFLRSLNEFQNESEPNQFIVVSFKWGRVKHVALVVKFDPLTMEVVLREPSYQANRPFSIGVKELFRLMKSCKNHSCHRGYIIARKTHPA